MKKLGIIAVGTLLFFGVSCSKSKRMPDPVITTETSSSAKQVPGGVRNNEPVNGINTFRTTPEVANNTDVVNITSKKNVKYIKNEKENFYNDPFRIPVNGVRNDSQDPYNNPNKIPAIGTRNDPKNPYNDPR